MTTVTLDETPSQSIVNAALAPSTATDARGRTLAVRRLNALDRLRLFEVAGAENVKNDAYMNYVMIAGHVTHIDSDPVTKPATKAQLEALIQRLDEDGLEAAMRAVADLYTPDPEADATLKNASGTPS